MTRQKRLITSWSYQFKILTKICNKPDIAINLLRLSRIKNFRNLKLRKFSNCKRSLKYKNWTICLAIYKNHKSVLKMNWHAVVKLTIFWSSRAKTNNMKSRFWGSMLIYCNCKILICEKNSMILLILKSF